MSKAIIEYKKPETLKILKSLAKYFDFKISTPKEKSETKRDEITIIPGDPSVDISGMEEIFSGKNLDAKELRTKAWQRTK